MTAYNDMLAVVRDPPRRNKRIEKSVPNASGASGSAPKLVDGGKSGQEAKKKPDALSKATILNSILRQTLQAKIDMLPDAHAVDRCVGVACACIAGRECVMLAVW